ncbi:MAG TPA: adenine phosphoribosyltransferase [Candidatus Merdimorpha stercoravium]|uniref:Adenine phosphoribosyltransferase n=1 Tax=Candidatus Merdimorpha stercoravium TaxID=2840863 RepID=A0A9D1KUJ4_9FLAO|nr:adenine phosphoribosyltransferase [Candidatus Merdimorpha stercoravium]
MKTDLRHYIRNIEDFPKPGVIFRDITPLLLDPRATSEALDQLCDHVKDLGITKVAAIESRGFFFGSLIAHRLGVGYIPVRKKGKLPFSTLSVTYDLEYGTDTLEIHTDAIAPGDRVLIHDDVLATGGTARAAVELIEKAGGQVVLLSFLMELKALGGLEKLSGHPVKCLMDF